MFFTAATFLKKIKTASLISIGLLTSLSASAASISTFRVFLDNDHAADNFLIFSKNDLPEKCNIELKHFVFDKTGKMTEFQGNSSPDNSASEWVRYTPRNFELSPMGTQTVRFSLRRKANSQPAEYRSYMSIQCSEIKPKVVLADDGNSETAKIGITPRLVQNVPIIVRHGKLDAKLNFSDIQYNDGKLTFHLNRTGSRSVYGRLSLIDKKSGDELNFTGGISIYTETDYAEFEFMVKDVPLSQLALKFVEDEKYGGSINLQQDVKL